MPAYLIAEITVQDPVRYAKYVEQVPEIIQAYGGRYLIRGGRIVRSVGPWRPERIIVVEFETLDQLERCFASPEYQALAPLREQATQSRAIIIESDTLPLPQG